MAFKGFKVSISIREIDEGEHFLRGLILAQQNNSSPFFPELIDGVNDGLEKARAEALEESMKARAEAGMP